MPMYRSAVDGLVIPTDSDRLHFIARQQIPSFRYPIMTRPFRTSYAPQSYPRYPNLFRSSTGPILNRVPNPRTFATTTVLRPTNLRWDSAINIVEFKALPFINQRKILQNPMVSSPKTKLVRSESLQIPNIYPINNTIIQKPKLDARHFCGLAPILEYKSLIREIPPFRLPVTMMR